RVVVLPEYRDRGLGAKAMKEAEKWIRELGYENIGVDSRTNAVGFYEKLGYEIIDPEVVVCGPFDCICMNKKL
ncbi:MAG: GNAT family N-acetyltransferase, partial [Bacillota bacterium]